MKNKLNIRKGWIVMMLILFISLVICFIAISYYMKRRVNEEDYINTNIESDADALDEMYNKFKELFSDVEEDLNIIVEGLEKEEVYRQNEYNFVIDLKEYNRGGGFLRETDVIVFNGEQLEIQNGVREHIKEYVDVLNEDMLLLDALAKLQKSSMIYTISSDNSGGFLKVYFPVNTEFTPFITNNNGVTNWYVYHEDKDCIRYGYREIKDNWYMNISEPPE